MAHSIVEPDRQRIAFVHRLAINCTLARHAAAPKK
jgi:hypothetical protein